jgi:acetyl esterase
MEKRIFVGTALATFAGAGMMRVAFLRRPPMEPFEPTGKERTRLALYQRPERWFLQHLKRPLAVVDGQTLDAKFQYMIEQAGNPDTAARLMRWLFATAPGRGWVRARADRHWTLFAKVTAPMRRVEDRTIPGRGGPIPIRIYWPRTTSREPLPILVYAHGGGYLFASVMALDRPARLIANEARVIVISLNYRLAPEHPYPAASDDGEDVFLWARARAPALGGDAERIAAGGDSAGAHIAVNIAQRQRIKGDPAPAGLLLYYPAVGLPHGDRSFTLFGKGYGLDASFFDYLLERVFPGAVIGLDVPDDLMDPLHAKSLAGLPLTLVTTAGFDILRDSGGAFAERLRTAGVPVVYRNYPSLTHSFLQFSGVVDDADRAATETARLFGEAIRQPGHDFFASALDDRPVVK